MFDTARAQGATEYLVLLAVVLIIALVSITLLGFFPGTATDSQITQSQTYWRSTTPIAILESGARASGFTADSTAPYFRIQNTGSYPIRIIALYGGGQPVYTFWNDSDVLNISDHYFIQPGEISYFGRDSLYIGLPSTREVDFVPGSSCGGPNPGMQALLGGCAAKQFCSNDINNSNSGIFAVDLAFEYIEYIDNNNQITKKQNGTKPLMVKCMPPSECLGGCGVGETCLVTGCCISDNVCRGTTCCPAGCNPNPVAINPCN